jgi:serine/threonine protein kinase
MSTTVTTATQLKGMWPARQRDPGDAQPSNRHWSTAPEMTGSSPGPTLSHSADSSHGQSQPGQVDDSDDDATQLAQVSGSMSESQDLSPSTPTTSTSENVWDLSIPVPGSKKGNLIYPRATVELSPWTGMQWQTRFVFVQKELTALVYRHLRLLSMESRPVYSLRMVGACPEDARPSVVITCRDVDAKNIRNLFRNRAHEQLSLSEDSESSSHSLSHLRSSLRFRREAASEPTSIPRFRLVYYRIRAPSTVIRNAMEVPITASIDTNEGSCGAIVRCNAACATLGVGLELRLANVSTVFLTVDHLWPSEILETASSPLSEMSRTTEDSMPMDLEYDNSEPLWDDDDEYDDDWATGDPAEPGFEEDPPEALDPVLPGSSAAVNNSNSAEGGLWQRIEPPKSLSTEAPYLDWALASPLSLQTSRISPSLINTIFPDGPSGRAVVLREIERWPAPGHSAPVYIVSGVRGIIQGQIITAPTFLPSLRPEQESCAVWTAILDDFIGIVAGECGSIVVNRATDRIFGHVVGSDTLGHAYVVPLSRVFEQVNSRFEGFAEPVRLSAPRKAESEASSSAAGQRRLKQVHSGFEQLDTDAAKSDYEDLFMTENGDTVTLSQMVHDFLDKQAINARSLGSTYSTVSDQESFQMASVTVGTSIYTEEPLGYSVPLDLLSVEEQHRKQGIRILLRPTIAIPEPLSDSMSWISLKAWADRAEDQSRGRVLAVTQTSKDISFSMVVALGAQPGPSLNFALYYDPASDDQIFLNRSEFPISLQRISFDAREDQNRTHLNLDPGTVRGLAPATWALSALNAEVLQFRILEKFNTSSAISRDEQQDHSSKEKLAGPKHVHAKLNMKRPMADVQDDTNEENVEEYLITKCDPISTTSSSSVYTAEHSGIGDGVVTVKVLKTRASSNIPQKAEHQSLNVIRQADAWLREYKSQEARQHESTVRLFDGDARYLSLYMEHIEAKDLSARGHWRDADTEMFTGSRIDALRVLHDIAHALNHLHNRGMVHNDVKPANILYSKHRGAVLCDFGLSTSRNVTTTGGTPYYIPPEFAAGKARGPPADIWALGVTMLYILGFMPLPDTRGRRDHPRRLYWIIADLHRRGKDEREKDKIEATQSMRAWLKEVEDIASTLGNDPLEQIVVDMLHKNLERRLFTDSLVRRVDALSDPKSPSVSNGDQTIMVATWMQAPSD